MANPARGHGLAMADASAADGAIGEKAEAEVVPANVDAAKVVPADKVDRGLDSIDAEGPKLP